jgi:hypothetical protein
MYKGGKIIASLIIFVAFLSIPFFYNMGKVNAGPENLAANAQITANTQCVEPAEYMRANHMELLNQWRLAYVRDGKTKYTNSMNQTFDIDLATCIECHSTGAASNTAAVSNPASKTAGASKPTALESSDQFCVSCHSYASVEPTCWSCHSGPGEATK